VRDGKLGVGALPARIAGGAGFWRQHLWAGAVAALLALPTQVALADEGGASFWIPGFFGSLAAVSQQAPGWSVTSVYYHTSVSAGGDVARAREITIGRIPANPAIASAASSRG